jgi:replicative DNA helicase
MVIGLMAEPSRRDLLDGVRAVLKPTDLWDWEVRAAYEAILAMAEAGQPWTPEAVALAVAERGGPDVSALVREAQEGNAIPPDAVVWHARLAARGAFRRRLLSALGEAADAVLDAPLTAADDQVAAQVESALWRSLSERAGEALPHISQATAALVEDIQGERRQWPTGVSLELDSLLGGLQPGRLVLVAARTGRGKTSCLLQMAQAAAGHGARVYFASYEMGPADIMARMLAQRTQKPVRAVRYGTLLPEEWAQVEEAMREMAQASFYLDCAPPRAVEDLVAMLSGHELDVVFIDYVQLMTSAAWADARWREVGLITAALKAYATARQVCVVAAAQLSRVAEARMLSDKPEERRPDLADLRESGNLEQDADAVLFLWPYRRVEDRRVLDYRITVGKNRHGPAGRDIAVAFDTMTQTLRTVIPDEEVD